MILFDVNILIYAFRSDSEHHAAIRPWLVKLLDSPDRFAYSELVLSAFVRIVTNPKAFKNPDSTEDALAFCDTIRQRPQAVRISPGNQHWSIFSGLLVTAGAKGNLVTDAYFAALAVEHDCEWVSTDRDYSRFKSLRWTHPLQS